MIAVIDDVNNLVYVGESVGLLPGSLLEYDMFGRKSIYRHITVDEAPVGKVKWDDYTNRFVERTDIPKPSQPPPQLSMDPSTDGSATLMKENENLKQRIIEQERQLNLIRSHLGL